VKLDSGKQPQTLKPSSAWSEKPCVNLFRFARRGRGLILIAECALSASACNPIQATTALGTAAAPSPVTSSTGPSGPVSITMPAAADTTIDRSAYSTTYATRGHFVARDRDQAGLVRFNAVIPSGRRLLSAQLQLNSGNVGGAGVSVYATASDWPESVTWSGAPPDGSLLGNSEGYSAHQWIKWNVTLAIPHDGGQVSFRIENSTDTWMGFDTRESSDATGPGLIITTVPLVTALALSSGSPSGSALPTTAPNGWTKVYADDFTGTALRPGWGAYNGAIPSTPGGVWSPSHVTVKNGQLILTTSRVNGTWTSGGVMNVQGGSATYGRFLIRMRMDKSDGVKYAILLWPASGQWPSGGEIDFAEDGGGQRTSTTGTLVYSTDGVTVQRNQRNVGVDLSQWHTLGVDWSPGRLDFTVDNIAWGTIKSPEVPSAPMNLAIQTEAGSCDQWMTCIDATTPASTSLDVDWVAVYKGFFEVEGAARHDLRVVR
jgi:hypothetical protein